MVIELNVGYKIPIYYKKSKLMENYSVIINEFQKSIKIALNLGDIELANLFWEINNRTITNMIIIIVEKIDIDSALEINKNYEKFLNDLKTKYSDSFLEWQIDIMLHRGDCFIYINDFKNALNEYENTKTFYINSSLNNDFKYLRILERICFTKYRDGYIEEPIEIAKEVLVIAEKLPKKGILRTEFIVKFNHFIGGLYFEKFDDISFSLDYFNEAFENVKKIEREEDVPDIIEIKANLNYNFGMYYVINGEKTKALKHFNEALEIYENFQQKYTKSQLHHIAELLWRILTVYRDYFSTEIINEFQEKFDNVIRENNRNKSITVKSIEIKYLHAKILRYKGEFSESLLILENAIEDFSSLSNSIISLYNSRILVTKLYNEKSSLLLHFEDFKNAEIAIVQSLNFISLNTRKSRDLYQLIEIYKAYANILSLNNDYEQAKIVFILLKDYIVRQVKIHPQIFENLLIKICCDKGLFHYKLGESDESLKELNLANKYLNEYLTRQLKDLKEFKINIGKDEKLNSHNEIIGILNDNFALAFMSENEFEKAKYYIEKAYSARKILFEKNPIKYCFPFLATQNNYSIILDRLNQQNDAELLLESSIAELEKLKRLKLPNINNLKLVFYSNLSLISIRNKKEKQAIKYCELTYSIISKNNLPLTLSTIHKAKINWYYEVAKSGNPNLKSIKLEKLNLLDTIREVEELPIIEKETIKSEIEHLYLWLLVKELRQLEKNQSIEWSQLDFALKIIATLRSGTCYLFKTVHNNSDSELNKDYNYNDLVDNLYQIMLEKAYMYDQFLANNTIISLHERMQDKSSKIKEMMKLNVKGNKLIRKIQEISRTSNTVESLVKYLSENNDKSLYIIQCTPLVVFHILLNSEMILVRTSSRNFVDKNKNLEKLLADISKIDSEIDIEKYKQIDLKIKNLSVLCWKEIPAVIRQQINKSKHLILSLCKESQNFPIELIGENGKELGLHKILTRIFEIESSFITSTFENHYKKNNEILLLIDPFDKKHRELPEALFESDSITNFFVKNNFNVKKLLRREVNYLNLLKNLTTSPQIIHYIGHGDDDGIFISDSKRLNPLMISNYHILLTNKPLFFINACYVGRTYYKGGGIFEGLIPSLMRRNSGPIIASKNWIFDDNSKKFSSDFYKSICSGLSIGEALLVVRKRNLNEYIWSNILLFGNPEYKL